MAQRHRRRLTFSLRTCFVAVSLLAIILAAFGARSVRTYRERNAASRIQRLGGRFVYQHADLMQHDGLPTRLMTYLLYEDAGRITHVSLNRTRLADDDMDVLLAIEKLQGLDVSNTAITDASIESLISLADLRYVNVYNTGITESGVRDLREARPSLVVNW